MNNIKSAPQKLMAAINIILNQIECVNVAEMGELLYFLDKRADKPIVRLGIKSTMRDFVIEDSYDVQMGYINKSIQVSARESYGLNSDTTALSLVYEMIMFVNNDKIDFDILSVVTAFGQVPDCELIDIEVNPVTVVIRNGFVPVSDIVAWPVNLRAFAFSFSVNHTPNLY